MSELLAQWGQYFTYDFVQYALLAGLAISLSTSLLGVTLVLRRYSYIGDGLSHVAFGAMAIAAVLGISQDLIVILPITMVAAILLLYGGRLLRKSGDAVLAMLSVGALATGYFLLNLFPPKSANLSGDVCGALFGSTSILTLTGGEVALCVGLSLGVVALFVLFYPLIFALTFDETFAKAMGLRVGLFNFLFALVIAIVIVLAMKLVGALLISALVVFPAVSALGLCQSFRGVVLLAAGLSLCCTVVGLLISIVASTPVGATIVVVQVGAFLLTRALALFTKRAA